MSRESLVLSQKQEELLDLLKQHEFVPKSRIMRTLDINATRASYMIRQMRKKFIEGYDIPYIYTSPNGYTIHEKVSAMAFETKLRLNIGMGMILNGMHVYKTFKRKSLKGFQQVSIEYKPRMLELKQIM